MATNVEILTRALAILAKHGVTVEPQPGWQTRTGSRSLTLKPEAVVVHHTGDVSTPLSLLVGGRSNLPGPLCNFLIGQSGRVYLVAAGYSNNAGYGGQANFARAAAGKLTAEVKPPSSDGSWSANSHAWAIEADGKGDWPAIVRPLVVQVTAALHLAHGWTVPRVIAHKELTRRKPGDPGDDMGKFRADVAALIRDWSAPAAPPVVVDPAPAGNDPQPEPKPSAGPKPLQHRVGTLNCAAWGKSSMSAKQIDKLVGLLLKMRCSIYCLTECPEWLRNHIRGACSCPKTAHRRFDGKRWLVRVRGSQAILRDSAAWRSGKYGSMVFGPTSYHGALWETLTDIGNGCPVTVGCYHLPPNSVSTQSYQKIHLASFLAKVTGHVRLIGGDGADSPSWFGSWDEARTVASTSPDRTAKTYQGKSISDRIHGLGVEFRGYIVYPSNGASDHAGVVAQITTPDPANTNTL